MFHWQRYLWFVDVLRDVRSRNHERRVDAWSFDLASAIFCHWENGLSAEYQTFIFIDVRKLTVFNEMIENSKLYEWNGQFLRTNGLERPTSSIFWRQILALSQDCQVTMRSALRSGENDGLFYWAMVYGAHGGARHFIAGLLMSRQDARDRKSVV